MTDTPSEPEAEEVHEPSLEAGVDYVDLGDLVADGTVIVEEPSSRHNDE